MNENKPDFEWYSSKSKSMKISPRCPIASSELCPRYYSSYLLLGDAGVTTKYTNEDKERLDRRWFMFKPNLAEEEAGIVIRESGLHSITNFCPEVSYDLFGLFASSLWKYSQELDSDLAHERLGREQARPDDPRWYWASVTGRHYTECREYSIYGEITSKQVKKKSSIRGEITPKLRLQVFSRDSFICKYCGRRPPEVALEVDHRISIADGGSNDIENLVTACVDCNRGKGAESR